MAGHLDYMRRDRIMTGTQHAAIDFRWLIANLEIGEVPIGVDDTPVGTIETFVLNPKAIHAAEAFVLGLFQLYPTVYFHKATRGAEKIFTELLVRVVSLVRDGNLNAIGLDARHPLVRFSQEPEKIDVALMLDDTVVWGALTQMSEATDRVVSEFSTRLRDRKLFKCHDIRTQIAHVLDPASENGDEKIDRIDRCCAGVEAKLTEWAAENGGGFPRVLIDHDVRSPYKSVNESKGPLDRINILTDGGRLVDLKERSSVVAALKAFKLFRAYTDGSDVAAREAIERVVREEIEKCRT